MASFASTTPSDYIAVALPTQSRGGALIPVYGLAMRLVQLKPEHRAHRAIPALSGRPTMVFGPQMRHSRGTSASLTILTQEHLIDVERSQRESEHDRDYRERDPPTIDKADLVKDR
jgi:hypothetical protein